MKVKITPERHKVWRHRVKQTPEGRAILLLQQAKKRAKERGTDCTLTHAWIKERIIKGKCDRTDIPFVLNGGNKDPHAPSLDRIDCSLGYTPENTRLVCWIFNQARSNYSDDTLYNFCLAVVKKHFIETVCLDDDDDLDTPGTGVIASDDNSDYWNHAPLTMTAGSLSCIQ
jgi:hypothetical protein